MNGKRTAKLLQIWNSGDSLTDKELSDLRDGLQELANFFGATRRERIMYGYFALELERIETIIQNRKNKF